MVPPPLESKRKEVELDDNKASAGLGEVYEAEFVRSAAGGTAEDKQEPLRQQARGLFAALCHKLDALTRFHFAPKPVLQDMSIRSEVGWALWNQRVPGRCASKEYQGDVAWCALFVSCSCGHGA